MLKISGVFTDGMVMQQRVMTRLYGMAGRNQDVRLTLERFAADPTDVETSDGNGIVFEDRDRSDREGYFQFRLPQLDASFDSYRLTLTTTEHELVVNDILVGEVWLAAGQDNMAQKVRHSDVDDWLEEGVGPEGLRFFRMSDNGLTGTILDYSPVPLGETPEGFWHRADRLHLSRDVSAVAFMFGYELFLRLGVPVGVIDAACAGTYIHSWLPARILEADPVMTNHVRELKLYRDRENWNRETPERPPREPDISREDMFARRRSRRPQTAALLMGQKPEPYRAPIEAPVRRPTIRRTVMRPRTMPLNHFFESKNQPGAIFNHKVAPLFGLALRGVIWLQGESDVDSPDYYFRALRNLVTVFSEIFETADERLHFVMAQLQPYLYEGLDPYALARFNEMLTKARHRLPVSCGLVTTYDLSPDYLADSHVCYALTPYAKKALGERMALVAHHLAYGGEQANSAPEPIAMERIGNKWMIDFDTSAAGGNGLKLKAGETELRGFAICGSNRVFVPARARILYGVRVIVWHEDIEDPVSVTYAFANFNGEANLTDHAGLPVTPFRMDLEPSHYAVPMPWRHLDRLTGFAWKTTIDDETNRVRREERPGKVPLWRVYKGRGSLTLAEPRTSDERVALCLTYRQADDRPIVFGPVIDYASLYPPLNLDMYADLVLTVNNPDHKRKAIRLILEDTNGVRYESGECVIADSFRDQVIRWPLTEAAVNREQLRALSFSLADDGDDGALNLINFELSGFDPHRKTDLDD